MIDNEAKLALTNQIRLFLEIANETSQTRDALLTNGINTKDLQKRRDSLIYGLISRLYRQESASLMLINMIFSKLEELPDNETVAKIKEDLSKQVKDTLSPIAEEFKRQKEREKNGGDMYQ